MNSGPLWELPPGIPGASGIPDVVVRLQQQVIHEGIQYCADREDGGVNYLYLRRVPVKLRAGLFAGGQRSVNNMAGTKPIACPGPKRLPADPGLQCGFVAFR